MAYFVTGATGFIGRYLVQELLANRGRWEQTTCPTSLRDVEPGVQLQLQLAGAATGDPPPPFVPRADPASVASWAGGAAHDAADGPEVSA